jgi:DNA-directed RNA polymerase specialized sigma24 family protein
VIPDAARSAPRDNSGLPQRAPSGRARRVTRHVENDEYAAFVRRVIRALGRRVGDGDADALAELARLRNDLEQAMGEAVRELYARGWSYAEIGARLGISRQAVRQQYGLDNRVTR